MKERNRELSRTSLPEQSLGCDNGKKFILISGKEQNSSAGRSGHKAARAQGPTRHSSRHSSQESTKSRSRCRGPFSSALPHSSSLPCLPALLSHSGNPNRTQESSLLSLKHQPGQTLFNQNYALFYGEEPAEPFST